MTGINNYGNFTSFSSIKADPIEKLAFLHDIRDKRLAERSGSSYHMENICSQIPDSLEGVELVPLVITEDVTSTLQCPFIG